MDIVTASRRTATIGYQSCSALGLPAWSAWTELGIAVIAPLTLLPGREADLTRPVYERAVPIARQCARRGQRGATVIQTKSIRPHRQPGGYDVNRFIARRSAVSCLGHQTN